ncbi:MAG: HD-GYP domain-containing protein [Planctomycetaceae bacterium]|nr:HD-GYP domain-containing protein [Planctomycetaceae bacterium]
MISPTHQFERVVSVIQTLQAMTQLKFEIASELPEDSEAYWQPQFTNIAGGLRYEVVTSEGVRLWGECAASARDSMQVRRLVSLACGQLRAEETSRQFESELQDLTEHMHEVYEHVASLHEVASILSQSHECESTISSVLSELSEAIDAQVALSEASTVGDVPESLRGRFQLQRSRDARRSLPRLLAVPLNLHGRQQRVLTAARDAEDQEFCSQEELILRSVATMLETHLNNRALHVEKDELLLAFVRSLTAALDARDHYTCGHSERVALMAQFLAEKMGLSKLECEHIYTSGLLHDLGKIGVRDEVLNFAGKLSPEQRQEIERHPVIGYDILSGIQGFAPLLPGIRHHHERWDGLGYPDQLAGTDIPRMARIMAVADAFDAMASDRPYRSGMNLERVNHILQVGAGTQWCPEVIAVFIEHAEEFESVWLKHAARLQHVEPLQGEVTQAATLPEREFCSAATTSLTSPE